MQQLPACQPVQESYPREEWELSQPGQSPVLSCQPSSLKRLLPSLLSPNCLTLPLSGPTPGIHRAPSQTLHSPGSPLVTQLSLSWAPSWLGADGSLDEDRETPFHLKSQK